MRGVVTTPPRIQHTQVKKGSLMNNPIIANEALPVNILSIGGAL